jgi:3-dehydroquinate synthase
MGSGKTTLGRQLAKELGLEFVDSDHEIERRTGASIPLIFDIEGEAGFRRREAQVIDELTRRDGIVLATGGGAVLDVASRQHLHNRGTVVYLHANIAKLAERTAKDANRPLLQGEDARAKLERLMLAREPLYREVAHLVVDTGSRSLRSTIAKLINDLERLESQARSEGRRANERDTT